MNDPAKMVHCSTGGAWINSLLTAFNTLFGDLEKKGNGDLEKKGNVLPTIINNDII